MTDPLKIRQLISDLSDISEAIAKYAGELDFLGDAKNYPRGSKEHVLAISRDEADFALSRFFHNLFQEVRIRAEKSYSIDLLAGLMCILNGDGIEAVRLMRRLHHMDGDETSSDGSIMPETFPDQFAWETYLRVSELNKLVEKFPEHVSHSAGQMHGWPMIVTHHLDVIPEFDRVSALLGVGSRHPLDVSSRTKRGSENHLMAYLEPMVFRVDALRIVLRSTEESRKHEDFARRIYGIWWEHPDGAPELEEIEILKRVQDLPPLSRVSAAEWSRVVLVPLMMLKDAQTSETCSVPALKNIWRHRSVKSRPTFRSRLHSAVTDTLRRYSKNPEQ